MTSAQQNTQRFQFSLRTLLLCSLASALSMQYREPLLRVLEVLLYCGDDYFILPPLVISAGFVVGRLIGRLIVRDPVRNVVLALSWILLALAFILTGYLLWARYRWLSWPRLWYNTARPWPFPDLLLLGFHDWLDVRRPASPGGFKIHGEFYAVLFTLDVLLIAFFGLVGTLLGIVAPGLPRWVAARLMQLKRWLQMVWSRRVARNRRGSPPGEQS